MASDDRLIKLVPDGIPDVNAVEVPKVAAPSQPATKQQLDDVERQMTSFERATLRWAKIAVMMSGLAALFVCAQWYEMHSGATDTRNLAEAAGTQAKKMADMSMAADKIRQAAENMVRQEGRLADTASAQGQVSERAWISTAVQSRLHDNGKALIVGQTLDAQFTRTNTGKTPAVNSRSVGERTAVERQADGTYKPPSFKYSPKNFTQDGTLMPGQSTYADLEGTLTQEDFDKITSMKSRVYTHGRIEYDDIFGVHDWVNFCAFLLPTGAWANCPYHNDVDKNAN